MDREELMRSLTRMTRKVSTEYYGYLSREREYGINQKLYMREAHFIDAIGEKENVTMSEVAEILEITQGAATQIAERLEKKGLIIREKDINDKRRMIVNLSETGRLVYVEHHKHDKKRRGIVYDHLKEFSEDDIRVCLRYEELNLELLKRFQLEEE